MSVGKVNRLMKTRCVKGLLRASGILGTVIIKACLVCFIAVCFYLRYDYKKCSLCYLIKNTRNI